jgi:hypothetical protein
MIEATVRATFALAGLCPTHGHTEPCQRCDAADTFSLWMATVTDFPDGRPEGRR